MLYFWPLVCLLEQIKCIESLRSGKLWSKFLKKYSNLWASLLVFGCINQTKNISKNFKCDIYVCLFIRNASKRIHVTTDVLAFWLQQLKFMLDIWSKGLSGLRRNFCWRKVVFIWTGAGRISNRVPNIRQHFYTAPSDRTIHLQVNLLFMWHFPV